MSRSRFKEVTLNVWDDIARKQKEPIYKPGSLMPRIAKVTMWFDCILMWSINSVKGNGFDKEIVLEGQEHSVELKATKWL